MEYESVAVLTLMDTDSYCYKGKNVALSKRRSPHSNGYRLLHKSGTKNLRQY